ncbi:hypothetical protein IG631_06462 [Alternaria alternata]|nr:hypothetical protein IG631_06462 [Alternaria alternata]
MQKHVSVRGYIVAIVLFNSNTEAASTSILSSTTSSSEPMMSIESNPQVNDGGKRSTSPGAIAGTVIGSIAGALAIFGAIVLGLKRDKNMRKGKSGVSDSEDTPVSAPAAPVAVQYDNEKYRTSNLPQWVVRK